MINDSAVAKEKLLGLSDIDAETIKSMSDSQLFSYIQALNVTAASYPLQKEELLHAFSESDYATVLQWLNIINSSLSQMHADNLAKECDKFITINSDLSNVRQARYRVFLDYFLPSLDLFINDVHNVLEALEVEEVETKSESIPTNIRDKIKTVGELNWDKISPMDDEELNDYIQVLNNFHSEFLTQANGLKSAIKIQHYVFVLQWLTALEESLVKIHASELAEDCRNQITINKDFNNIRHEKLEVFINYMLSTVSMLSSDIKMLRLPKEIKTSEDSSEITQQEAVDVELLSPGSSPDAKTILIVNKMKMFMNSLKNALGDTEYKLIGVTTAESTVKYLKTAKPNLFIVDEDLPGTDIYLLTKVIRKMGQLAPIIFTTSKIRHDKMAKFVEAGVADFILKPITPADVQKKIKKQLM